MPFVAGFLFILQICFVIHVLKTGRETFWIGIIMMLPGIGCAAYFFTRILPGLNQSHTVNKVGKSLIKSVDPQRELRARKLELERADTIENRRKLAAECVDANLAGEAIVLLKDCLKGGMETDPHLLMELATAYFAYDQFEDTRLTLEKLIESNPDFKSHDGHLLYARSLEKVGSIEQAATEYESVVLSYPGEEARVRYGMLLRELGRVAESDKWFNESIARANRAPAYYKKKEAQWLKIAREQKT